MGVRASHTIVTRIPCGCIGFPFWNQFYRQGLSYFNILIIKAGYHQRVYG